MSQCCQSTDSFVKTLFGPRVAVLCSQDAEIISRRNNLSFAELIRPFCTINTELKVHDPSSNQVYSIRDLHITVCDLRCNVPDESVVEKILSVAVKDASDTVDNHKTWNIDSERYQVNVNVSCPWFETYRDTFTSLASQKSHEFINHCLSCLLVVSSSHPNPLEEFSKLSQHQNFTQHSSQAAPIRWMTPNTLKYYVLLHDNSNGDIDKACSVMNDLQGMYGPGACHLLRINSKSGNDDQQLPDPWSRFVNNRPTFAMKEPNGLSMNDTKIQDNLNVDPVTVSTEIQANAVEWVKELKEAAVILQKGYGCCLTLSDHDSLRKFLLDFASNGLIPHMEKLIRNFHEQISSRKSLHRSIFRVTRTIFGGNKAASAPALKSYGVGGLESPELQVRKIADLFFLCQMYEHAFNYYHSIRKDFANEQAWLHAAGASEMAAFSNFMQVRAQRPYPAHYVDSAIDMYLSNSTDKYPAIRCALISLECLRTQGLYYEAAIQLKKLISEDNDLQSAIIWEQIAQCYLRTKKPNLRKFAFFILLSGHRYNKAIQYNCALTCYETALQVYKGTGWGIAIDFINFTIGKLFFQLQKYKHAATAFQYLLKESSQSASQQAVYLNEFLHVTKFQSHNAKTLADHVLPVIAQSEIVLRSTEILTHELKGESWDVMEEALRTVTKRPDGLPCVSQRSTASFEVVVNEPLWVDIPLHNPLQVALALRDITLIVRSKESDVSSSVDCPPIKEFVLLENSRTSLSFCVNPQQTGLFEIVGLKYSLSLARITSFSSQMSMGNIELIGHQLFNSAKLIFTVCPPMPKLQIISDDTAMKLIAGEICAFKLAFANVGQCSMKGVRVAFNLLSSCLFTHPDQPPLLVQKHFLEAASRADSNSYCSVQVLREEELNPGEQFQTLLWFHAPEHEGRLTLDLLFYYEPTGDSGFQINCRTLKYTIDVYTRPSLAVHTTLKLDNSQTGSIFAACVKNSGLSDSLCCTHISGSSESWAISQVANMQFANLRANQSAMLYVRIMESFFAKSKVDRYQSVTFGEGEKDLIYSDEDSLRLMKLFMCHKNGKLTSPPHLNFLTLALHWTAQFQEKTVTGQHYLHLPNMQNDTTSLSKLGISQESGLVDDSSETLLALHQMVSWKFKVDRSLTHDFTKSQLCFVPVTIVLQNKYGCELRVNVNGTDTKASPNTSNQAANQRFMWTGKSLSDFRLPPKGTHSVIMDACFCAPGIYNVNSFGVWAVPVRIEGNSPLLPQNCSYSCLVTIRDGSILDT